MQFISHLERNINGGDLVKMTDLADCIAIVRLLQRRIRGQREHGKNRRAHEDDAEGLAAVDMWMRTGGRWVSVLIDLFYAILALRQARSSDRKYGGFMGLEKREIWQCNESTGKLL